MGERMAFMSFNCQPAVPAVFQGCNVLQQTVAQGPQTARHFRAGRRDHSVTEGKSLKSERNADRRSWRQSALDFRHMARHFASDSADGLHSGVAPAVRSISLSMSGTSHGASIGLIVPRRAAEKEWIHLSLRQQTAIPNGIGLVLIMILTLSLLMGSLVKAHLSPS
jgi:hypothetical protein